MLALPGWAVQMYGYAEPPPLTAERRTEIRQALGVLDAVFLGEPGVLEARQRIVAADALGAARHEQAGRGGGSAKAPAIAAAGSGLYRRRAAAARRSACRCPRRLRLAPGLAAVQLAVRGGVRYAGSAPRLFAAAGEHRQQLRNDLALQTAEDVAEHARRR